VSDEDPTAEQLPAQDPSTSEDPSAPAYPSQELPEEQPPKGRGRNRGKSDEARGHNKPEPRFEGDPNVYPDPDNPDLAP
jgi:hypothetical protein